MKVVKEIEDIVAGEKLRITIWDNESVMVEFGDGSFSLESIGELLSFAEVLHDLVELEMDNESLPE